MKKLLRAASVLALGSLAYPVAAAEYSFLQEGWSDGGTFSGTFTAVDSNNDGQISSFDEEVSVFNATYTGGDLGSLFFNSLDAGPFGFEGSGDELGIAPTGLVFSLDGSGQLGDDFFGQIEGLGVYGRTSGADFGNDRFLAVGPGPFNQCDGTSICSGVFDAQDLGLIAVATNDDIDAPQSPVEVTANEGPISILPEQLALATNTDAITVDGDIGDPNGIFETSPVLPNAVNDRGGFVFNLDDIINLPGEIFFIDPEIAVGYTYTITGGEFTSVQAPSFATVADDEYTLTFNGQTETLMSGERFDFAPGDTVLEFVISGINPNLMLDPADAGAFVTGVAVANVTTGATITQTPITVNAVPLPASGVLLLSGIAGIAFLRRRRSSLRA